MWGEMRWDGRLWDITDNIDHLISSFSFSIVGLTLIMCLVVCQMIKWEKEKETDDQFLPSYHLIFYHHLTYHNIVISIVWYEISWCRHFSLQPFISSFEVYDDQMMWYHLIYHLTINHLSHLPSHQPPSTISF